MLEYEHGYQQALRDIEYLVCGESRYTIRLSKALAGLLKLISNDPCPFMVSGGKVATLSVCDNKKGKWVCKEVIYDKDAEYYRKAYAQEIAYGKSPYPGGTDLIFRERSRQIAIKGFSNAHDDQFVNDELARVAACYALPEKNRQVTSGLWPENWNTTKWKPAPDHRIVELVRAGALIVAEIDRLQRCRKKENEKTIPSI